MKAQDLAGYFAKTIAQPMPFEYLDQARGIRTKRSYVVEPIAVDILLLQVFHYPNPLVPKTRSRREHPVRQCLHPDAERVFVGNVGKDDGAATLKESFAQLLQQESDRAVAEIVEQAAAAPVSAMESPGGAKGTRPRNRTPDPLIVRPQAPRLAQRLSGRFRNG
jgi:hypothetical protein